MGMNQPSSPTSFPIANLARWGLCPLQVQTLGRWVRGAGVSPEFFA